MAKHLVFRLRKVVLLSASFFIFLAACKKEGELNPDFVQNTSSSFFTDSILIESKTVKSEAILSDQIATGLTGEYQDSAFGKTIASIYLQPILPTNSLVLAEPGEELLLDSVILSMQYESYFGDTNVLQTLDVFELDQVLNSSTFYLSDTSVNSKPTPLGSKSFFPRPETPVVINQPNLSGGIDTLALNSQLRIRLSDDFGNRILNKSGQDELDRTANFIEYFKGIKVTPQQSSSLNDNERAILYFAITASETKIGLFYKVISQNGDTTESLLNFPINSTSVRFNTFEHDFSLGAVKTHLDNTGKDSTFSLVQAMAGVETVLEFPDLLSKFDGQNIVVNKAELVLPVAAGSYAKFGVASTLILVSRNANGNLFRIPDSFESQEFFGGEFDANKGSYVFNIARFIQGVLNGSQTNNLVVLVTGSAVKAERAVLYAPTNKNKKIKLNLHYSKTQ